MTDQERFRIVPAYQRRPARVLVPVLSDPRRACDCTCADTAC